MNILSMAESCGKYIRAGNKDGGEFHGPCPGCGGNDRFHIWPEQNNGEGSFWCRACGAAGDIIQFLMDFEGKTYHEACQFLDKQPGQAEKYTTPTPAKPRAPKKWAPKTVADPADLWREKALKFVNYCHEALLENKEQMDYLAGRGLDPETVISARLGWNPENRYRPRESWGLETIEKSGKKKKLWLPVGIVIPYFMDDQMVRVKIRRPKPEMEKFLPKLKYYMVPGSSHAPMLLGPDKDAFAVIEAELDGLLVFQETGDKIGVCALGSLSTRPDEPTARILRSALVILDCLDYDGTAVKDTVAWKQNYPQTTRWPVPIGKDPGEAVTLGVDIRQWILAGLPARYHIESRRVGRSRFVSADAPGKSAAPESGRVEAAGETPLQLLARAMQYTPLKVVNHPRRLGLISKNKSWKQRNWSAFGRVSDLLFDKSDDAVRSAVKDLPYGEYGYGDLIKN